MKILIISQYYYPEQFQINDISMELVKRGHKVSVLCGVPNYPKGVVFPGYETYKERLTREEDYFEKTGVKVIHVDQVPRGQNLVSLFRNYISFMKNGRKVVEKLNDSYDVVLGYQLSPISSMEPALKYKELYDTPVLFYTLDVWPVSAESMLKSKKNPLFLIVANLSKKIYQGADRILVTSRPFIDYLTKENGVENSRIAYLPQHAGTQMLSMDLSSDDNGVADFMFAGNLGNGQRLDVIIDAAAELGNRNDYKIHFVGDGSMKKKLEKMVEEKRLQDNVIFHGNQKREDMPSFYKMADALLITLRGNNEVGNTMPGKLQMYMTTGKPVLGAINGAAFEVIHESGCGDCVKAGDSKGLAKLMLDYIENPANFSECGNKGREYFKKHFTLDIFMDALETELKSLICQNSKN